MLINGRKTGVLHDGTGAPALFLHCALAKAQALQGLMACFRDQWAITAPDLPGHGRSEFDSTQDFQDQAVATAAELLAQNDRPAHLFGHSFGATVALRLALEHPKMIASLTLYEPVYFSLLAGCAPDAYAREQADSRAFTNAATAGNWPDAARAFLARWSQEQFDDLHPQQQAYILKTIPLIVASQQSIIFPEKGGLILNLLSTLKLPVLLLKGAKSPPITGQINAVLADKIAGARSAVIPGAGHMGPITHAALVHGEMSRFLSGDQA